MLASCRGFDVVVSQITQIQEEQARKSKKGLMKNAVDLFNGFCELAHRTSGIVSLLLPQSPEYTVYYPLPELLDSVVLLISCRFHMVYCYSCSRVL